MSRKEKSETQLSGVETEEITDHNFPDIFSGINQLTCKPIIRTSTFASEEIYGQLVSCNEPSVTPRVLTCEDLEQYILSGMKENNSTHNRSVQNLSLYAKDNQPNSANDNGSSQYLLSLLQDVASLQDLTSAADKAFHPAVDKCSRSAVISSEDVVAPELSKVGEFDLIEETRTGYEQDSSTFSSNAGFDENDGSNIELCLPEEDSLITVDYPIIPQYSEFTPTWNSLEPDFTKPVDNIAAQLGDLNHVLSDERSAITSLEGSPFLRSSCGIMGTATPYHDWRAQESYPHFQHSQMGPQRPSYYPLHSPEMSSQITSMDWNNYRHSPRTPHYIPENVHRQPFTCTCAVPTRFHYPVHNSLQQHIPEGFPVSQPNLNVQRFPQHPQQPSYGHIRMENSGKTLTIYCYPSPFHSLCTLNVKSLPLPSLRSNHMLHIPNQGIC